MFARIELPAAIALIAAAAAAPDLLPIFVGLQSALHIAVTLRSRRSYVRTAFDGLLILAAILAAVSAIIAPFPGTVLQALRLLSGIVFFRAALGAAAQDLTSTHAMVGIAVAALLSALAGFFAALAPAVIAFHAPLLFVPLSAAAALAPRSTGPSLLLRITLGASAVLGIVGAMPQLVPVLITAAVMAIAAVNAKTAARPLSFVVGMLAVGHALLLFGPHAWTNTLLFLYTPAQIAGMHEAWDRAVLVVRTLPFTGAGPGGFAPTVNALFPLAAAPLATDAHNLMLQIVADLGIPGGLVLGAIFARVVTQRSPEDAHWLRHAAFCAFAAILIDGITSPTLWLAAPLAPLVWLMMGGAVRLQNPSMKQHTKQGVAL